jgi:hypothetical protein
MVKKEYWSFLAGDILGWETKEVTITSTPSGISKSVAALIKRGLAEDADGWALITKAGRAAVSEPVAPEHPGEPNPRVEPTAAAKSATKAAQVISLLEREQGATLAELVTATGWLPHTTRAALTGLRKKGHTLDKATRDGVTCYSIAKVA